MKYSRLPAFPKLLLCGLVALALTACSKEKLTDESIDSFVQAYQNLAAAGPQLKQKLEGAQDDKNCDDCEPLLEDAATKAGYEDYDDFLDADERIRGAAAYIQINETMAKVSEGMGKMSDEKNCMQMMAAQKDLSEEEKKEKCKNMAAGMGAAQGVMPWVTRIMKFFVEEEDVEAVRPHVGKIDRAINNPALPCEFDFTCKEKNVNLGEGQM